MRNFTVKEISDILNTNPETVRRWIRDDRLEAVQASRKDGNVVSESALNAFLKQTPKYAAVAATSLATGLTIAGLGALSDVATSVIMSKVLFDQKNSENLQVTPKSMEKYIQSSIDDCKKTIDQKKKKIAALKKAITDEEQQIKNYTAVLEKIGIITEKVNGKEA